MGKTGLAQVASQVAEANHSPVLPKEHLDGPGACNGAHRCIRGIGSPNDLPSVVKTASPRVWPTQRAQILYRSVLPQSCPLLGSEWKWKAKPEANGIGYAI